MGFYDFQSIEKKWQQTWKTQQTYAAPRLSDKPKYYVMDMFPYPSGAGLHVGHPLGYIATDIVARFKRLQGFNVLHPMGYDAFGLPAEQYALETGQHPAVTTAENIATFKKQLEVIGLGYDPQTTEMRTADPDYYKWTQWIFLQIFDSWYNLESNKAEAISTLREAFAKGGSEAVQAFHDHEGSFTAAEWQAMSTQEQDRILLDYRLAYPAEAMVNWCPALGTVLANDEVINGRSERGNHPVERRAMRQWQFRMTAYADRLLEGLDHIDWPHPMKEMQRNWIGRSEGAQFHFDVEGHDAQIEVFSTRPDTLFGSTFMVLAPEHELISQLTTAEQKEEIDAYVEWASNRTEVERQQEKKISGVFTGAYATHPLLDRKIPIWTADYVLAGYGTGAIMAVPAHDERDYAFAKHFGLEIIEVVSGGNIEEEAFVSKEGQLVNSHFLNGLSGSEAIRKMIEVLEEKGLGQGKVNYRLRDPNFSRQRYWGEPFPIVWRDDLPYAIPESELPLRLPEVDDYHPTGSGESPLAKAEDWVQTPNGRRETNTMPGYAGSSWYFFRYLDPQNPDAFVDPEKEKYWMNVDLYIGGSEHAVGHLLYSRFWTKFLFDRGFVSQDEPFGRLVNQGMIQGRSSLAYRVSGEKKFVSEGLKDQYDCDPIHVYIKLVSGNDELDVEAFKQWRNGEFADYEFVLEDGVFKCGYQVEKMSKRYHNVVNPDDICEQYGADTFRMYEMFLGPLEVAKPFSTQGIEGVFKFLKKAWNLFTDEDNTLAISEDEPSKDELRILHQTIKKVGEDIEKLSFNTAVAQFMICANELQKLKCNKKAILKPFIVLLAPFAPHFAEEIWEMIGEQGSVLDAQWPEWKEDFLKEDNYLYPIQVNGKVRTKVEFPKEIAKPELEKLVVEHEEIQALIEGKTLRKVIAIPGRIVNLVAN